MSDLQKRAQEIGFHRAALEAGATITDGPLRDFQGGWGHPPLMRSRRMIAHHWQVLPPLPEADGKYTGVRSACGVFHVFSEQVPMLAPGNLPFCVRCENKLMKAQQSGSSKE
jgi:hypothetical protein